MIAGMLYSTAIKYIFKSLPVVRKVGRICRTTLSSSSEQGPFCFTIPLCFVSQLMDSPTVVSRHTWQFKKVSRKIAALWIRVEKNGDNSAWCISPLGAETFLTQTGTGLGVLGVLGMLGASGTGPLRGFGASGTGLSSHRRGRGPRRILRNPLRRPYPSDNGSLLVVERQRVGTPTDGKWPYLF